MNYETLLDEIMINTLSAQELITPPQKKVKFWVCPLQLEFHASIFLTGALLAFDQNKPIIFLIQVPDLPESALNYQGEIGPHFWRIRNENQNQNASLQDLASTTDNHYPYLDKLFAYLGVINPNPEHLVIFVKAGEKNKNLTKILAPLLEKDYSLLVMSNTYENLSSFEAKNLSSKLIQACKTQQMSTTHQENFPALACLSQLSAQYDQPIVSEFLFNTGEMGMDQEKSTSMRCMLR